jgi:Fe-S-cluster containining protein
MDGADPGAFGESKGEECTISAVQEYRELLGRIDSWYESVRRAHPDKVTCVKGCRDCCLGLFDISIADRDLLREGLAQADPATRRDIEARASRLMTQLRERFPDLEESLDGRSERDIDDICDFLGDAECPVLGPAGECRLYAHRPLICRLSGVPVVDVSGAVIHPEGCSKCTLKAEEAPRIDYTDLRKRERRLLKSIDPERSGETLLIPQALEPRV